MSRKPIVAANWKMRFSHQEAVSTLAAFYKQLKNIQVESDVVICPAAPSLPEAAKLTSKSEKIQIGAQAIHWEETGAVTGGVSVLNIKPFAKWCIVGHSDQRALLGLTENHVLLQLQILLRHGITPIICVGETAEEKAAGKTAQKVKAQIKHLFQDISPAHASKLIVAYEPIWAISSNADVTPAPDPNIIAGILLLIRKLASEQFGAPTAERMRIVYGGSVDAENVASFVGEPGVDGVLVGSASLRPSSLIDIIQRVQGSYAG